MALTEALEKANDGWRKHLAIQPDSPAEKARKEKIETDYKAAIEKKRILDRQAEENQIYDYTGKARGTPVSKRVGKKSPRPVASSPQEYQEIQDEEKKAAQDHRAQQTQAKAQDAAGVNFAPSAGDQPAVNPQWKEKDTSVVPEVPQNSGLAAPKRVEEALPKHQLQIQALRDLKMQTKDPGHHRQIDEAIAAIQKENGVAPETGTGPKPVSFLSPPKPAATEFTMDLNEPTPAPVTPVLSAGPKVVTRKKV